MRAAERREPIARPRAVVPEVRLASRAALSCALLVPVAAAVGQAIAQRPGALGAATGAAILGGLSLASLPLYAWAARRGTSTVARAALGGVALRLGLALAAFALCSRIDALSMPALAAGLVAALVGTFVAELRLLATDRRLTWIDTTGARAARERTPA